MSTTLERIDRSTDGALAVPPAAPDFAPVAVRSPLERLRGRLPADPLLSWICTLVITTGAAVLRLVNLDTPKGKIFDEVYYATEGQELLDHGYEANPGYMFIVHPPLGKWLIALGQAVFGRNELGWRMPSAIAGTLCVLVVIRVVRRMTRSTLLGSLAGILLAADGLFLVMSRVALLDIFLALFVLAGFACLVVDRDRVRERLAVAVAAGGDLGRYGPRLGPRPWRLAGGVLLGLSCGVKWSGVYFLAGFALLSVLWDRGARRTAGVGRPSAGLALRDLPAAAGTLVVVPVLAYLATWTGWFLGENSFNRHWADTNEGYWSWLPGPVRSLLNYHSRAYDFHTQLDSFHPYKSTPWSWLVDGRPVSYYYPSDPTPTGCGSTRCVREILAIGTPMLWWAFIPALVWMLWWLVSRRDWRAGAVLMAFVAGWAVWLLQGDRTMFIFYMTPLVPFLVIGVTLVLGDVLGRATADETRRLVGLLAVCGYVALVVVNFIYLHPILTGRLLTYDEWHARIWFQSWI